MFTLPNDWEGQDVTGWIMSEKLDGWRTMWTGKEYVTRGGLVLDVPKRWLRGMPATSLDGELWGGYGSLYEIPRMMRYGWRGLSFTAFDSPLERGAYSERLHALGELTLPPHCGIIESTHCDSVGMMQKAACDTYAAGGEGVVVRDPGARYRVGRVKSVLRLVPYPLSLHRRVR
jgi:DNA ligase-1